MKYLFTIFFSCVITSHTVLCAQQVNFIKYTVYDGLVANPVRCIYQDSKGFIWIGTYDGLSRYDGNKFTNYTSANGLSHNFINSIFEVKGKVLVSENNGSIDNFENDTIKKSYKAESAINFISMWHDRVILSSDANGLYELKNDKIISPAQQTPKTALGFFVPINDSLTLICGVEDKLYLYKNDLSLYASLENQELDGEIIYSVVQDSKKRIWACTSVGLKLIQITYGNSPHLSLVPLPPSFYIPYLNNISVTSMIEEKDGSFWIGTFNGLVRLLPGGTFHVYNEKDGLPSARINSLYSDKEKNIWIGTALGLAKWVSRNNVVFFNTESDDFRNDILNITLSADQKIILSTSRGLQYLNVSSNEYKNIKAPDISTPIPVSGTSPMHFQYKDYIGTLNAGKSEIVSVTKLDTVVPGVVSALKHPAGSIFLGSFFGLFSVHKNLVTKILPFRIVAMSLDSSGYIWAGTWQNGLFRIKIKNSTEQQFEVNNITARLNEKEIRGLFTDSKKNIWVGTRYGGAFCLTPKANNDFDIQHFNRQMGLMSDFAISFAETKTGDMWVGTHLGIDRLVKESYGYRIFNFSKAVNFFAEIKKILPDKDYWICHANTGIAIFKDEELHKTAPLQPLIFSSSHGVLENKLTLIYPTKKISLKPYQNSARFEFGALGFINEKQILYSYRLFGSSDTSWSKPQNIHEASYASLSPGNYSFQVKTIGWNGEEGYPAMFSFTIRTPFWKQWWFIALCFLILALLVYSLYRYRIRQLIHLQKVRTSIATDLHDEIGSSLTNISFLAELSRKKNQTSQFSETLPLRIAEESNLAQQALDDIIWSVNSNNDNLEQTTARLRRYAAEIFEPAGISCIIDYKNIIGDYKLNMEQRKDIYLVFKECLNNIVKHAAARNVIINIHLERNVLHMHIQDDGKGFDTSVNTHRNGLKNIKSRIEKWNGKINVQSAPEKGTVTNCTILLVSPK